MIVMTGANGRLGRLVAKILADRGAAGQVTLTSREPEKIADLAALGFRAMRADFSDPQSMCAPFTDATTVLMISMPGPVEERIPCHRNAFDAAKAARVGRLIYTSRVNPTYESLYPYAKVHAFSEGYLKAIALTTTIVRNNEYIENVVKLIREAKLPGRLMLPGTTGKVAYIALHDIAEILATLLLEDGHAGKTYELNGPEAISRSDIARLVSEATKRPTVAAPITREEFSQFLKDQGRPAFLVEMVKGLCDAIDAGEFAQVRPDARQLLGRQPRSPREYFRDVFAAA
jgi:NAD(P)H dehydrogenase (quinone)